MVITSLTHIAQHMMRDILELLRLQFADETGACQIEGCDWLRHRHAVGLPIQFHLILNNLEV